MMPLEVPDSLVIDESNFHVSVSPPEGQSRGHIPRNWEVNGFCQAWRGASPFPKELIVPRDQWDERLTEMQAKKATLKDLAIAAGLPCKDQNGTNYCWINAPTHCCELMLLKQNQRKPDGKPWILSPASVGCKIKGFRNQGGWGQEGLEYIIEHGIVPVELWPANAISRSYDTAAAWIEGAKFKVPEWYEIQTFDEKISAHFLQLPTADGYNWWSHEVTGYSLAIVSNGVRDRSRRAIESKAKATGMDAVYRDQLLELAASKYGAEERNSWAMSYGDRGFFYLTESKARPSDCCAAAALLPA